jgi:hypothetical protein
MTSLKGSKEDEDGRKVKSTWIHGKLEKLEQAGARGKEQMTRSRAWRYRDCPTRTLEPEPESPISHKAALSSFGMTRLSYDAAARCLSKSTARRSINCLSATSSHDILRILSRRSFYTSSICDIQFGSLCTSLTSGVLQQWCVLHGSVRSLASNMSLVDLDRHGLRSFELSVLSRRSEFPSRICRQSGRKRWHLHWNSNKAWRRPGMREDHHLEAVKAWCEQENIHSRPKLRDRYLRSAT